MHVLLPSYICIYTSFLPLKAFLFCFTTFKYKNATVGISCISLLFTLFSLFHSLNNSLGGAPILFLVDTFTRDMVSALKKPTSSCGDSPISIIISHQDYCSRSFLPPGPYTPVHFLNFLYLPIQNLNLIMSSYDLKSRNGCPLCLYTFMLNYLKLSIFLQI